LNMVVKAGEEAVTGIYTLKLVVGCNEGYTYTSGIEVRLLKQTGVLYRNNRIETFCDKK